MLDELALIFPWHPSKPAAIGTSTADALLNAQKCQSEEVQRRLGSSIYLLTEAVEMSQFTRGEGFADTLRHFAISIGWVVVVQNGFQTFPEHYSVVVRQFDLADKQAEWR
ncbi:hypothetical protein Cabther_A0748 [Chloracidobacterium thermophilum B]|uniref:Uncharacterized protein n=1 Tax=Chloracidobacterium thermophilum (strain B) TaxID=981222 RepID=G2LH05_CHLTF|nr:hypothetical protein Cabther_A0748 [Chloracidobacterium thermophilum B]